MNIVAIRHAQSANHGRLQGLRTNEPLTDLGIEQSRELVIRIKESYRVAVIFTSPLDRAFKTSTAVAFGLQNTSVQPRNNLKEIDFGLLNDKTWSDIEKESEISKVEFYKGIYDFSLYNGESTKDTDARIINMVAEAKIYKSKPAETIVFVTHGGIIRRLYALYQPFVLVDKIPHCSIHTFKV